MNAKQKGLLLWASAPVAAYLVSSKGWFFSLAAAAGASYLAYRYVLTDTERRNIARFARTAGYVSDVLDTIGA